MIGSLFLVYFVRIQLLAGHITILETENKVTKANLLQTCRCINGLLPCKELFLSRLPESVEILENSCLRLSSLELNYIRLLLVKTLGKDIGVFGT